jgi:methylase of polypeptide subunit release factors
MVRDLAALASPRGRSLAAALRELLREVHFDQVNRDLRLPRYGGDYDIRPFPLPTSAVDQQDMKVRLRDAVKSSRRSDDPAFARRIQQAFALFMFGQSLTPPAVQELFGPSRSGVIDDALALELLVNADGQSVRSNALSLFSMTLRNGSVVHLFADTPPHFQARAAEQRVYVGADSYELVSWVSAADPLFGYCVEMGSGSGIQLIAALKQHPAIAMAIGQECDRRAAHVSLFNAALNAVDEKFLIVPDQEELRRALGAHRISFAMSNPPFIAMPARIDSEGLDGEGGLDVRALFPAAGWGGDSGLHVTKEFVDTVFPLLEAGSRMAIYSQFAGDEHGPAMFEQFIQDRGGFRFAFEPVAPRRLFVRQPETGRIAEGESHGVLSAAEAALSVARLIVAALMARREPARMRVAVPKGGPDHALLMEHAARIAASYQRQGITHFHDGVTILTRELPVGTLRAGC